MKRTFWMTLLLFLFTCSFALISCANGGQSDSKGDEARPGVDGELAQWVTMLDMTDPIGDDYGSGTYLYPTNNQFAPFEGIFDIERFKILTAKELVSFQITFGQITNPWNAPHGFSHKLIQIYIDHRPGGERHTLLPGARVVFSPRAPWDSLIKVTGWGVYLFDCKDKPDLELKPFAKGEVQVLDDARTIQVTLPINEFSNLDDLKNASYYLLVGGYDGFGPDNYRVIKQGIHEWYFGGGDDSGYAPNVIDILVPPGKSQQKILGSYDPANNVRAVLEPVSRPNPVRKGLIYSLSILICALIWIGWRKREIFTRNQ